MGESGGVARGGEGGAVGWGVGEELLMKEGR